MCVFTEEWLRIVNFYLALSLNSHANDSAVCGVILRVTVCSVYP